MKQISWSRLGGYEVSSMGDKRFSALYARLADGRTIEEAYQLDCKNYREITTDWRIGKGKKPYKRNISKYNLYLEYKELWIEWARENLTLMRELYRCAVANNCLLSDRFAHTEISQARALSEILNEFTNKTLSTKNEQL